jgi:hypothetical protein
MIEAEFLSRMERISTPELEKTVIYYDALARTLVFLFLVGWTVEEAKASFKVTSKVISQGKKVEHTVLEFARPNFSLGLIFWLVEPAKEKENTGELLPITVIGDNRWLKHIVLAGSGILHTLDVHYVDTYQAYLDSLV